MPTRFIQKSTKPIGQGVTSLVWPNVAEIGVDTSSSTDSYLTFNPDGTPRQVPNRAKSVTVAKVALSGAAIHSAVVAWTNPEAGSIVITRATVDVTTIATAAAKLDIGTTATNATTASDNLLDGIDVNASTGLLGIADGDAPGAGNGKPQQKLASAKWVTIKEISGDARGLVGVLYIEYYLV